MKRVYLDHSATTPLSRGALNIMTDVLENTFGNPSSQYTSGRTAHAVVEKARRQIASAIGAEAAEICFTSGGTESDNWVIRGLGNPSEKKDTIVTTAIEHHAILNPCAMMEKQGWKIRFLPVNRFGQVLMEKAPEVINENTALVSVMTVNNELGTIQPISEIARIAHDHGALFHTDAVQASGHLPLHVDLDEIDLLSMSAHKFYGPKGIGALYIRKGTHLPAFMLGGAQERDRRAGTENTASIAGMGAALEEAVCGIPEENSKLLHLRGVFLDEVMHSIPEVYLNSPEKNCLPGIMSLYFKDVNAQALLVRLDLRGIEVSAGAACTAGSAEKSHVLIAAGADGDVLNGTLRFSMGRENTEEEMRYTAEVLKQEVAFLRNVPRF